MRSLDDKDRQLLDMLRADSRQPLKALAAGLGLSVSAVQERVTRLRRDGVIAAFTIEVPEEHGLQAFMLVTTHSRQCSTVAPAIAAIEGVHTGHSVAGDIDLVLQVSAPSLDRLQAIRDAIARVEGVADVVTLPVMTRRFP